MLQVFELLGIWLIVRMLLLQVAHGAAVIISHHSLMPLINTSNMEEMGRVAFLSSQLEIMELMELHTLPILPKR